MQGKNLPFVSLTSTSNQSESCRALFCRIVFPAFVTNTVGTQNFPFLSVSSLKACLEFGNTFFPRTSTPSMSKRSPNSGG